MSVSEQSKQASKSESITQFTAEVVGKPAEEHQTEVQVVGGATELDVLSKSDDPLSALSLLIALLAALGIGSIVAATISRWNSISLLRQEWVNSLRDEISSFFHRVDNFGALASSKDSSREHLRQLRLKRDEAMAAYRQIMLRLNFKEVAHRRLDVALMGAMDIEDRIDDRKMVAALVASRRVLKEEWERTKFGPFLSVARRYKSWSRRRHLSSQLKKRRTKPKKAKS